MLKVKRINGIKTFGYIVIAMILVGIGFLSAMLVQKITRPGETAVSVHKTADTGKNNAKVADMPGKQKIETAMESPSYSTPAQSITSNTTKEYPPAGITDTDISRDTPPPRGFVTTQIIEGKKPANMVTEEKRKKETTKAAPAKKQRIPSIAPEKWEKSENTNVYVIHGNRRIDPYTGKVIETIDSTSSVSNIPSQRKTVSSAPPEQKVVNNYYYTGNTETGKPEKDKSGDTPQTSADDKEFWHGGYSAISTNPQTTIGEAYRERLKNWPCNNDMSYCGPDNYYDGYSSSSGYTGIGNIYIPTGTGGYGRSSGVSGYVKIGNIYLPVGGTYYRR